MFYLFIAILCSLLSGYLFKKASGTISLYSPNMMSVIFYLYFIVNNVIGAILIVNQVDDHYAINKLSDVQYRYYGFWTILYTIVLFPVGQLIANAVFRKRNINVLYDNYVNSSIIDESSSIRKHVRNTLLVLSFISVLSVVYTLVSIGGSPIGRLFSGADVMDLAIMRSDAKNNFGGNEYIRNIFGLTLTPFLSFVAYGYSKCTHSKRDIWWFRVMFIASILIVTYDLEKAPILFYLLGFLFFRVYLGNKLTKKFLIIIASLIMVFIILMYVVLSSFEIDALFVFNRGILGRMTLSSNAGVFISYEIFPSRHNFLGFSSFSSVLSSFWGMPVSERSARYVMEYVNPGGVNVGIAGVYNSLFVSEAWANWGIVGVILSPVYVGFIIQCLYLFLLCNRKTPFFMALFVIYTIRCSINGGVNDYIYNVSTVVMLLVYYLVYHFGVSPKSPKYKCHI